MNNDQLKSIIKACGWSQEQLARNLNVSFATINSWLNGRSLPRARAQLSIEELSLDVIAYSTVFLNNTSVM